VFITILTATKRCRNRCYLSQSDTSHNVYYVKSYELIIGILLALALIFNYWSRKYGSAKEAQLLSHILGVDESEVERMDKEGGPVMAERLLRLWDRKYIHAPGWEGFVFSRGALIHKNKRWRPENLFQHRKDIERIEQLECEIYKLYSLAGLIKIAKILVELEDLFVQVLSLAQP